MATRPNLGRIREAVVRPYTAIVVGGCAAVVALLFDSVGLAILIASLILPVAVLLEMSRRDLFESEPWGWVAISAGFGAIAGVFIGLLNIILLKQFERETDPAFTCCGPMMSRVNLDIADAGAASILVVGIIVPIIGEVLKVAGPLFVRQQSAFRNEVMDGVLLGSASGGAFAAAAAITYFWPVIQEDRLGGSVGDWTAALLGVLIVRPGISCATSAILGAALWRGQLDRGRLDLLAGAVAAFGGAIATALVGLITVGGETRAELAFDVVIFAGLAFAARIVVRDAVETDRLSRAAHESWITCPVCGSRTPPGRFCAQCGAALVPQEPQLLEPGEERLPAADSQPIQPLSPDQPTMPIDASPAVESQAPSETPPLSEEPVETTSSNTAEDAAFEDWPETRR